MRCDGIASVDEGGNRRRKADRRHLKGLPEGNSRKLHRSDVLRLMHDRSRFPGQIHSCLFQQVELFKIAVVVFRAQSQTHRDEHRVAGIHGRLHKCLRSMARDLVAADSPVLHHHVSRTVKGVLHGHHAFLQRGRRGDGFENRTRLIGIADTGIAPHLIQKILLFFFRKSGRIRALRQGKRVIQVEFRHIHHRQNLPVVRLHHQDGDAFRLLRRHHLLRKLFGILLNVEIHADVQIISVHRLQARLALFIHFNASGVRHRQDGARLAFQIFFIFHLQTDNALIVRSCKAQHSGCQTVKGIVALIILIHLHSGKPTGADRIAGFLIHVAFDPFDGGIFFHTRSDIIFLKLQFSGQNLHHRVRIRDLIVYDGNRAYRPVIRQHVSGRIQNPAPLRLNASLPLMQRIRRIRIVCGAVYHQIDQPTGKPEKSGQTDQEGRKCLFSVEGFMLLLHRKTS